MSRARAAVVVTIASMLATPVAIAQSAPPPSTPAPVQPPAGAPCCSSAPPRSAVQAAEGMTSESDEAGRSLRPFGPGVSTRVYSTGKYQDLGVYVARAVELRYRPTDYAFVKVGRTPIEFELPPNANYWLEVESPAVQRGTTVLRVDSTAKRVEVSPGRAGVHDLGTFSLAVGVTAVLAGAIVFATGSKADTDFNETAIAVPLLAGGGLAVVLGAIAYRASRTKLVDPDDPAQHSRTTPRGVALRGVTPGF